MIDGYLIECTNPSYVSGLHRVWVTGPDGGVRARGKGDTVSEALVVALETWGERGDLPEAEAAILGVIWDRLEFRVRDAQPAGVDAETVVAGGDDEVSF